METARLAVVGGAEFILRCLLAIFWLALIIPGRCQSPEILKKRIAAEHGDIAAQLDLASHYDLEKDYVESAKWYRKAADQGDADAQNCIGYYYLIGIGVAKDYTAAVDWYRKSASQGNGDGLLSLGSCYRDGKGVNKDSVQAYALFNLAASSPLSPGQMRDLQALSDLAQRNQLERVYREGMNEEAARQRDALEKQMLPQQIAEAQRVTKELRVQIDETLNRGSQKPIP